MSKKLKFDLTVAANALLCPNPGDWIAAAYLGVDELAEFRNVPGVKEATKLGSLEFDPATIIQAYACAFSATDGTLDAIDITPCKFSIMTQICQSDLEDSWLADTMRAGSNNPDFAPADFMGWYYDRIQAATKNALALLAWQGDTTSTIAPFDKCDGLEKKLLADATVIDVAATTVTASNVLTEIAKVIVALPAEIAYRTPDLRLFVSSNVAQAYQIGASTLNVNQYISEAAPLQYQGIKMVVCPGMSDNTMVCTLASNMIYAFDAAEDFANITTISMRNTTGDDLIRTRANMKFFVGFSNGDEIVYYN